MKLIADILLISVNSTEGKAVLDVFSDGTGAKATLVNIGNHAFHDLGAVNGLRVAMVQSEMGSVGLGASLQTAQEAIATTQPGAVIMVGVCFGVNSGKQQIGEVLVSKQIADYEPQRVGVSGGTLNIVPRGTKADASTKLLSHFRAIDLGWDPRPAKVAFGLILSGEKLVDNPDFRASLLKFEPEALGGEMEGAGLYAACQKAKCDWILTKGICDWADGNKGDNKDANQQLAALNAAKFVFHALQSGTLNFKSDLTTQRARRISGSAAVTPAITITINKTLDDFGLEEQAALVTTVASLGHVSRDEVQVLQVSDGSVKVSLTMPESSAHKLSDAWQTGSGSRELKALGVTSLEVRHVQQPSADLTLRDRLQQQWTKDFFISYTQSDVFWAEWIAWQLEENGYKTVLQAWDFRPGANFIDMMDRAAKEAERIIAVFSPNYLTAPYPLDEWTVSFVKRHGGGGRLLPVCVQECDPQGLLSTIIPIDLVGLSEEIAKDLLLKGVVKGRTKPVNKPRYPGPSSIFPGILPPVWKIPHNRNLHFTGREDFLVNLHNALNSKKGPGLAQALVGHAGAGKTQIAIEYAYRYVSDYKVVWWLRAEALASDYGSLARALNLSEKDFADQNIIVTAVQEWLAQNGHWLLIFDNAQNQAELNKYLPPAVMGHILITSQNSNWGTLANVLRVKDLDAEDAAKLLLKRME